MKKLLTLLILITVSCNNNTEPPLDDKLQELIPLADGNYWIYQGYSLYEDGSLGDPDYYISGFKIDSTYSYNYMGEKISSYRMFTCSEDLKLNNWGATFYGSKLVYNGKDGFHYSGIEKHDTLKRAFDDLLFTYPPVKGKTLLAHAFYHGTIDNIPEHMPQHRIIKYGCITEDSLFSTPFGKFKCLVYKGYIGSEVYYFIKPGLGIVGIVVKRYSYKTKKMVYFRKYVLKKYKLFEGDKK